MNKICTWCGHETWHCGHGGHCFDWKEFDQWVAEHGKSKEMTKSEYRKFVKFFPREVKP